MSDSVVQVQGLRKVYGSLVAVDSLDLSVPKGAVFGLLGPNGAGKSTTFGILCGWLGATAGSARVLGIESNQLYKLRGKVAALPQDAHFPPNVSVHQELRHFGRLSGLSNAQASQEADRVLAEVGLSDAAHMRGAQLSHGMLKRVGLAQTLLGKPELIFLDEPTAGLDPKSARQVKDIISNLAPTTTVVLSSHNLVDVQEICTHGAILDHGKLAVAGSIDVLTRRGAEITIEVRAGANVPIEGLKELFGADCVRLSDSAIKLSFDADEDPATVIAKAMKALLDAGTPVLGITRGTSLETAFLEVTQDHPPPPP